MTLENLLTLYRYDEWANTRLLDMSAEAFGEETDLRNSEEPRIRAIQETLTHIAGARQVWRVRWQGITPKEMLSPTGFPTVAHLRALYTGEFAQFDQFASTLTEASLSDIIRTTSFAGAPRIGPLRQMMEHVITHSAYHRGQVTARIIDLGKEPVIISTDLIGFYDLQRL